MEGSTTGERRFHFAVSMGCGITDGAVPTPTRSQPAWVRPMGKEARRRVRRRVLFIVSGVVMAVIVASFLVVVVERLLLHKR